VFEVEARVGERLHAIVGMMRNDVRRRMPRDSRSSGET
jgi:hypothetical protein